MVERARRPRPRLHDAQLHISVMRAHEDRRWVLAKLTKSWWGGPGAGGRHRVLAEVWMRTDGMREQEVTAAVLRDLAACYLDEGYRP